MALDLIVAQWGPDAIKGMAARLSAPVFPGDRLTLVPTAEGAEVRNDDATVALSLTILWRS